MTVAAVILAATPESALAPTPTARRACAGLPTRPGPVAQPRSSCAPLMPDGSVASALANAEVTLVEPAPREAGPVGQIVNGVEAAARLVAGTEAALVWPARMAWVDAETVTSLIAGHGEDRTSVVRPAWHGEAGFPFLLPLERLAALRGLGTDRMPDELLEDLEAAGVPFRIVETGDPGVTHDVSVARDALPPYDGPPEPVEVPEWGAAVADQDDAAPVAGPRRLDAR